MVMYESIVDPAKKILRCAFNVEVWSASDRRVAERIETCDKCPNMRRVGNIRQCKLCKCILACKARVPTEECPIGKWKTTEAALTVSGRVVENLQDGPH